MQEEEPNKIEEETTSNTAKADGEAPELSKEEADKALGNLMMKFLKIHQERFKGIKESEIR